MVQRPRRTIKGSGSIVRSSIPAFRAEDPGPNPGRSTKTQPFLVNACEPAYLTPNSGSLQKTIEGVSLAVENVGDRAAIGEKTAQK